MENILKKIGKEWVKGDGTVRYYINDWKEMIDLKVGYYNTGNVSDVTYKGNKCSNNWYKKYCSQTKVWISPEGEIHIDYCKDDDIKKDITDKLTQKINEKISG